MQIQDICKSYAEGVMQSPSALFLKLPLLVGRVIYFLKLL